MLECQWNDDACFDALSQQVKSQQLPPSPPWVSLDPLYFIIGLGLHCLFLLWAAVTLVLALRWRVATHKPGILAVFVCLVLLIVSGIVYFAYTISNYYAINDSVYFPVLWFQLLLVFGIMTMLGTMFLLAYIRRKGQSVSRSSIKSNRRILLLSGAFIGFNWILLFEAYRYTVE